ncbi:hypothetical protein [Algibacter mikhailovii]|nr:hypothetical protein [Algibacter mikhailovii]
MELRHKKKHRQVLNPFIGFGWFTGNSTSKPNSSTTSKSNIDVYVSKY